MFDSKQRGTVIAKGLKIVGSVTAEGLVEVNGQIDGELHCTSLVIARGAHVTGTVAAERVVVDGTVEGPIEGGEVILKSQAHVVGDIHHQSLAIERGAFFDGRSMQIRGNGQTLDKLERKSLKQISNARESLSPDREVRGCGSRLVSPTVGQGDGPPGLAVAKAVSTAKHTVFTVTSGSYGQSADDHRVEVAREAPLSFLNAIEVAPGFLHVTSSSACPFFRVYAAL